MLGKLLDLIWPRTCEVCKRPVDRPGRYLCSDCLNRLSFIPTDGCCRKCGREAEKLTGEFLCEDCRTHRPHFDRAASALRFEADARDLVNAFKFRRAIHLRDDLVDALEGAVRARFKVDEIGLVLSTPITLIRRFDRGYNQCDCIAAELARRIGRPFARHALKRCGSPKRQGSLTEDDRRTNVIGTFAVTPRGRKAIGALQDKSPVLVIDDIMTTGSTLSECAKTLKEAGAAKVWCATLARSIRL